MIVTVESILAKCEDFGECKCWTGRMNNGTPAVYCRVKHAYIQARRFMHEATFGRPIRNGYYPFMKCRDSRCVNVEHMALLTMRQIGQALAKAGAFSSPHRNAALTKAMRARKDGKLTMEIAREIRHRTESGPTLARVYGVDRSLIRRIQRGEAWREGAANNSVFNMAV